MVAYLILQKVSELYYAEMTFEMYKKSRSPNMALFACWNSADNSENLGRCLCVLSKTLAQCIGRYDHH